MVATEDLGVFSTYCGYFSPPPTVHLETTHELDFKTPKFPHHVIYSRYRLDKENPYMQKNL